MHNICNSGMLNRKVSNLFRILSMGHLQVLHSLYHSGHAYELDWWQETDPISL